MLVHLLLVDVLSMCPAPSNPSGQEWREFRARLAGSSPGPGSARNAAALKQLDERLWRDYTQGVWAHGTSLPEPGALLLALPLQAQLIQEMRRDVPSQWAARLRETLAGDTPGLIDRLQGGSDATAFAFAWKSASTMCNRGLGKMRSGFPSPAERKLWAMQCAALERRAHVCLVLGEVAGGLSCVVLSKQLSSHLTPELARRLLRGRQEAGLADEAEVDLVLRAFGSASHPCPVYWGGGEGVAESGVVVHGRDDLGLRHSAEIENTRIFAADSASGICAAAEAVVDGAAQPLDFRLTIGRTTLSDRSAQCEWTPVACSRPLVLKPSPAGLPKPLWHEVMQACGGECAEMSRLLSDESSGRGSRRNPNRPRGDSDL